MTVEQWLEANGGPRRFETGASGDPLMINQWLQRRGWEMWHRQNRVFLKRAGASGRGKAMSFKAFYAFVDDLRSKEGLQPIVWRVAA